MATLKELIENSDSPSPRATDDFFWRLFQSYRVKVVAWLTSEQKKEILTLPEADAEKAVDIIAEKQFLFEHIVPPTYRYMVMCKACGTHRPLPVKRSEVDECAWCHVLKGN